MSPYRIPREVSQETITAELYHRARSIGLTARLRAPLEPGLRAGIAFYDDATIYAVVVVLPGHGPRSEPRERNERAEQLDLTGLPWRYCLGAKEINETLDWVLKHRT